MSKVDISLTRTGPLVPGVLFAAVAVFCGFNINWVWGSISPLTASLIIGAVLGNIGLIPAQCDAGLKFAARHILRAGIILLGLQLSFNEVAKLGSRGFVAVIAVVAITFFGTQDF